MTRNFRKGVFSSHKPLCPHPEASLTPSIQKNPVGYIGIPTPHYFSKKSIFNDQISPEPPGIPKQSLVRPPGSLEVINYNEPNSTISAELLLQKLQFTYYIAKTMKKYHENEQKIARKESLFRIKEPHSSKDEVFRKITRLIETPSIMIGLTDEVVQEISEETISSWLKEVHNKTISPINQVVQPKILVNFSEKFISIQISFNQWYGFFNTMWMINNQFNWFEYYRYYYNYKKFDDEIEEDDYEDTIEYQKKCIIHKRYVASKRSVDECQAMINTLLSETINWKKKEVKEEMNQMIKYILEVVGCYPPDIRFKMMKNSIKMFREKKERIEGYDKETLRTFLWEQAVEGAIIRPFKEHEYFKSNEAGMKKLLENRPKLRRDGRVTSMEGPIKELLIITRKEKEMIETWLRMKPMKFIEQYKRENICLGTEKYEWLEEFKKREMERRNGLWNEYFQLKKKCNQIKYQSRTKSIQEETINILKVMKQE
jgi:hypothetical protein